MATDRNAVILKSVNPNLLRRQAVFLRGAGPARDRPVPGLRQPAREQADGQVYRPVRQSMNEKVEDWS